MSAFALMLVFVIAPLSVSAQAFGNNSSFSGSGAILKSIVGCNSKGNANGLSSMFGKDTANTKDDTFSSAGVDGAGNSVPTSDKTVTKNTADTKKAAEATNKKLRCENALAKAAAQMAIRQITFKTVNWINSGYGGQPAFVQNENSFMRDIADKSVLAFAGSLYSKENADSYPFGRIVTQSIITNTYSNFSDKYAYTLDDVIKNQFPNSSLTAADYNNDFALGGWDAFDAQFKGGNNPFGFYYEAQNQVYQNIEGNPEIEQTKNELARNNGFLDLKKCVAKKQGECQQWETQTPGIIIAGQLETVLGSPVRQLENGQDLNASITAIFDGLLDELVKKGLSQLK